MAVLRIAYHLKESDEWKDLEERGKMQEEIIRGLEQENKDLRQRLAIVEGSGTRTQLAVGKLEGRMNETTTRSMRDNIIVKNMDEEEQEDEDRIEDKVLNFFNTALKIGETEMSKIRIERAHRMGKKARDRTRNIVMKLNSKGKSIVMRNLKNLDRRSSVKISEQFPPEVHAQRNKLWPAFISAKQQGKTTRWIQDKLQIDGKQVSPPTDKNRNINVDTTEAAMSLHVKHTAVVSRDNSHLQGHSVKIASIDDVAPAIKALCADTRVAGANHLMYAYRVGSEQYSMHNWEDDGEWGSARWIMDSIEKKNVYGQLVCVARWCSGQHEGRARMDTIREIADQALQGCG